MSETPSYLKENDDGVDITLAKPAVIAGAKVSTLRMREPTAGDMERHQSGSKSPAEAEVRLIADLCEISPEDVRALTFRNYKRAQEALSVFTE